MKCDKCQQELPAGAKFCPQCGASVKTMSEVCPSCAAKLPGGAIFCPSCGQKVSASAEVKPDDVYPLMRKVIRLAEEANGVEQIEAWIKQEHEKNPSAPTSTVIRCLYFINQEKPQRAQEQIDLLIKNSADYPFIHFLQSGVYSLQEKYSLALEQYKIILEQKGLSEELRIIVYIGQALAYSNLKDTEQAVNSVQAGLALLAHNVRMEKDERCEFYFIGSTIYMLKEDWEQAYWCAQKVLELNPEAVAARYLRAYNGFLSNHLEEVRADCDAVLNSQDASEEDKENVRDILEKLDEDGADNSKWNTFITSLYSVFWADFDCLLTDLKEAQSARQQGDLISPRKLKHMAEDAVDNAANYLKNHFPVELTPNALEEIERFRKEQRESFLTQLEEISTELEELKDDLPEGGLTSMLGGAVEGFIKGSTMGWLGAADAFLSGSKEDKKNNKLVEKWNNSLKEMLDLFCNTWGAYVEFVDTLAKQLGVEVAIEEGILETYLKEQRGELCPLLPRLQSVTEAKDNFYCLPDIPDEKLGAAKRSYAFLEEGEKILCLFDSTLFGGADDGAVFTDRRVHWKAGMFDDAEKAAYKDIESIYQLKDCILLVLTNGEELQMAFSEDENNDMLRVLTSVRDFFKENDTDE